MDYRLNDLRQRANVQMFTDSPLDADQVRELGMAHVFVATGARWRTDGIGRSTLRTPPVIGLGAQVMTPDDIMAGAVPPAGPVMVYDDDNIYLAGVIAEKLAADGHEVTFVTPESLVSPYASHTLEQHRIQARLIEMGVNIRCNLSLASLSGDGARLACVFSGAGKRSGRKFKRSGDRTHPRGRTL